MFVTELLCYVNCVEFDGNLHVKDKSIDQMVTFATGFRQYIHMHLHGIKQTLHIKMRQKVKLFETVMQQARRDQSGPKNWKEQHIGISEADRELKDEEQKVEEVF